MDISALGLILSVLLRKDLIYIRSFAAYIAEEKYVNIIYPFAECSMQLKKKAWH